MLEVLAVTALGLAALSERRSSSATSAIATGTGTGTGPGELEDHRIQQWFKENLPSSLARRYGWKIVRSQLKEMLLNRVQEKIVEPETKWRKFWHVAVKRLGIRGTAASALMAADGPLVFGDLLAMGLTLWTIYDLTSLWFEIWFEVDAGSPEPARPTSI